MKRKHISRLLFLLLSLTILSFGLATVCLADSTEGSTTEDESGAEETIADGFYTDGTGTYYYQSGAAVTSAWITDGGKTYYFTSDGTMATGLQEIDGSLYYFSSEGVMQKRWVTIDGKTYYFSVTAVPPRTGLLQFAVLHTYCSTHGGMKTRWVTIDGAKYYFSVKDGAAINGLRKVGGKYYYFTTKGKMKTKWVTIDGAKYYFSAKTGVAVSGLKKISGSYYYFTSKGKMKTGWVTIDGEKYYFASSGKMVRDTRKTIGKKLCTFDEDGVLVRSIDTTKPMVALTYDDGPSIYTDKILSVLKKYDSVATFFVVGDRVSTYSSTVKKAYEMGCEIGNHTYSHATLTRLGTSAIKSQISKTNSAVKKVTGVSPVVMRPPGGSYNSTVRSAVGMPLILWSIDTLDWKTRNASSTISAVVGHVSDGDIVLMHDLYSATATASETIIPQLVKKGYQLVTVSELAECRGGISAGSVYTRLRP
ncbi:MAG: polysaccharide deacetylase family protein [Lachnospiraceae bacterium]|nr:polysaccharide deacetylase family protein [Lachnospiraceae bacterium]